MSKARIEKLASFRRREAMKDKRRLESLFAFAQQAPDREAIAERAADAHVAAIEAAGQMAHWPLPRNFGRGF
jgi:hypothetical protein